jgi:hypothetical protein
MEYTKTHKTRPPKSQLSNDKNTQDSKNMAQKLKEHGAKTHKTSSKNMAQKHTRLDLPKSQLSNASN